MSPDVAKESLELVEKNQELLEKLDETMREQRMQIANIEAEMERLGLSFSKDLPMDQLTDDQKAQLTTLQADIERIEAEMAETKIKVTRPRAHRMMV